MALNTALLERLAGRRSEELRKRCAELGDHDALELAAGAAGGVQP